MSRRRRRKQNNLDYVIGLVLLLVVLGVTGYLPLPHTVLLVALGSAMIVALILTTAFVTLQLLRQAKTRAGLRKMDADQVGKMTGIEFERYVGAMLEKRGFKNIQYTKARNDDGIDITARLGKARYAIQAKRYSSKVGKTHIYPVTSARDALQFDEAMVVTNSTFTADAEKWAKTSRCKLVDGYELARWRVDSREKSDR